MSADGSQQEIYMNCMRMLGERWEGARWVFTVHRAPVCVFIPSPPPTFNDFPPSTTLTEFVFSKTLRDPLRSLTTTSDLQRPPIFVCVLPPFLERLDFVHNGVLRQGL